MDRYTLLSGGSSFDDTQGQQNFGESSDFWSNASDPQAGRVQQKTASLITKNQEKVNKLNPDPTISLFNNQTSATNNYTPEQLQTMLGASVDDTVYFDDPNFGPYQLRRTESGSLEKRRFDGDVEYLYAAPSKDGNVKLGVSKYGFKERYTPGLAAEEGLTKNTEYGWSPGEQGVDPTSEPYLNIALPAGEAKRLENIIHTNRGQIANRAGGYTREDFLRMRQPDQYGSGATEYFTEDAPLWNIDSTNTAITGEAVLPKRLEQQQQQPNSNGHTPLTEEEIKQIKQRGREKYYEENTGVLNAIKGGLVTAYDEAIGKPARALESWVTGKNDETLEEYHNRIDNLFGINYNRERGTYGQQKRAEKYNAKFDKAKDWTEYAEVAAEWTADAITDPNTLATSIGTLVAWLSPGKIFKAAGVGKNSVKIAEKTRDAIDTLVKRGDMSRTTGALLKAKNKFGTKAGLTETAINQTGQLTAMAGNLEEQYQEWVNNNGGKEPEEGKAAWILKHAPIQLLNQNLDAITDLSIIKAPEVLKGAKSLMKSVSEKSMPKFIKGVATTVGSTAFKEMPKEAAQEYLQEMMELYNTRYDTEAFKDVSTFYDFVTNKSNWEQARGAALEGAGGAVQFKGMGAAKDVIVRPFKRKSSITDTDVGDVNDNTDTTITNDDDVTTLTDEELDFKVSNNYQVMEEAINDPQVSSLDLLNASTAAIRSIDEKINRVPSNDTDALKELEDMQNRAYEAQQSAVEMAATRFVDALEELWSVDELDGLSKKDLNALLKEDFGVTDKKHRKAIIASTLAEIADRIESNRQKVEDQISTGAELDKIDDTTYVLKVPKQEQTQADGDAFEMPVMDVIINTSKDNVQPTENGTFTIKDPTKVTMQTAAAGSVPVAEPNVNVSENSKADTQTGQDTQLDSDTANTDTHTEGFTSRLLNKLAKQFNVPSEDLQKTLNTALGSFALKKMKSVSSTSSKVQYEKYFGKDGIVTTYTAYRAALANGNANKAAELLTKIKNIGYQQEKKLHRYSVKYEEMKGLLQDIVNEAVDTYGPSSENTVKSIETAIKVLDRKDNNSSYKPQYAKAFKITAADVIKDIDMPAELQSALGIPEGSQSRAIEIMEAIYASIDHVDSILKTENTSRPTETGHTVSLEEDLDRYKKNLKDVIAKLRDLKGKDGKLVSIEKEQLLNQKKNLEEAIERVAADINAPFKSKRRWVSSSDANIENAKELEERLKELRNKVALTDKEKDEIKDLTAKLADSKEAEAVLAHVESQLGKPVGVSIKDGDKVKTPEVKGNDTVKKVKQKTKEYEPTVKVPDGKTEKEVNVDEFTPVDSEEKLVKKAEALNDLTEKLQRSNTKTKNIIDKLNTAIKSKKESISVIVDKFGNNVGEELLAYDRAISVGEKEIQKLQTQLNNTKEKKRKVKASLEKSINKYAEKLSDSREEMDGIKDEIVATLDNILDNAGEQIDENTDKKTLAKLRSKVRNTLGMLSDMFKNIRNAFVRHSLVREAGILDQEIDNLTKALEAAKSKVATDKALMNDALNRIGSATVRKKIENNLNRIKALYSRRSTIIEGSKEKRQALLEKINTLTSELKGTHIVVNAMDSGLKSDKDTYKNKGSEYDQPLNIHSLVNVNDSVLGGVPLDSLVGIISDPEIKSSLQKRLNNASTVLENSIKLKAKPEFQLLDSPMSSIVFQSNGKVNPNIAKIIAFNALSWIGTEGNGLLINDDSAIASMLGYPSKNQVTYKERKVLQKAGKLRKNVAYSLGSSIYSSLGLTAKDDVPEALENKMKSDLGLIALSYLSEAGLIENITETSISSSEWNSIATGKTIKEQEKVPTVKGKSKINGQPGGKVYSAILNEVKALTDAINLLPDRSDYSHKPITMSKDMLNKIKGSMWEVPEKAQKVLETLMKKEYKVYDIREKFEKLYGKGEEGRVNYLKANGWRDVDEMKNSSTNYTADALDKQEGINRGLEAEYDDLFSLYERIDNGIVPNSLYFKYAFTIGGRFNLDSGTINPQGKNLLHRFAVLPSKAHDTKWDINSPDFKYFKEAVLQGLGIGTDKLGEESIKSKFDQIAKLDLNEVIDSVRSHGEYSKDGISLEVESPSHFIMALDAMEKYHEAVNNGQTQFRATAVAEYDSITSGFANRLMQIPILDDVSSWLEKVGVFSKDKFTETTMGGMIEKGNILDSYKTLVQSVIESEDELSKPTTVKTVEGKRVIVTYGEDAIKSMKEDWRGDGEPLPTLADASGKITSAARNMFKYPFMIFNYGASIKSIRANLAKDLAAPIIEGIINNAYSTDTDFMKYLGLDSQSNLNSFIDGMKTKSADKVFVTIDGKRKYPALLIEELLNDTYGAVVQKTMDTLFSDIVEYNNMMVHSTKLMFNIFKKEFRQAVDAKESSLKRPLTKEEINSIIYDLKDAFPIFKGPLSSGVTDGVAIFDSSLKAADSKYITKGGIKVHKKGNEYVETTVQALQRQLTEAHAAGAVLPMHWIDGTIIHDVMAEEDVQGIHDAITIGSNHKKYVQKLNTNMLTVGKTYNLTQALVDSLMKSIEYIKDPKELDNLYREATLDENADISQFLSTVESILDRVQKGREELYSKELIIANFAGPSGTEYRYSPVDNAVEDVIKVEATTISKKFSAKIIDTVRSVIDKGC